MASFAAQHAPISTLLRHALSKFATVRILVTARAGAVLEAIRHQLHRVPRLVHRVAFRASDGQMRASKRIAAFLMLRDGVCRGLKAGDDVTRFALAIVWRCGKLAQVRVCVAVHAFGKCDLVASGSASRHVAFRAQDGRVLARQRVGRGSVRLRVEERRPPTIHGMARGTFSLVLTSGKLATVRIGLVTIRTFCECHHPLEISARVAEQAIHFRMFSEQRIFRFRMIELLAGGDSFPPAGGVTSFTRLRKASPMRIAVAI